MVNSVRQSRVLTLEELYAADLRTGLDRSALRFDSSRQSSAPQHPASGEILRKGTPVGGPGNAEQAEFCGPPPRWPPRREDAVRAET